MYVPSWSRTINYRIIVSHISVRLCSLCSQCTCRWSVAQLYVCLMTPTDKRERWSAPQGCAHVLKCENGVMVFPLPLFSHFPILLSHHHSLFRQENLVSSKAKRKGVSERERAGRWGIKVIDRSNVSS